MAAGWLNIYIFHSLVTFPCCHSGSSSLLAARAVDRLLSANLIWTQRIVHRESGTRGSETGERKVKEGESYTASMPANSRQSACKWPEERQRCGGSISICKVIDLSGVILDCGLSVINRNKTKPPVLPVVK